MDTPARRSQATINFNAIISISKLTAYLNQFNQLRHIQPNLNYPKLDPSLVEDVEDLSKDTKVNYFGTDKDTKDVKNLLMIAF